MSATAKPAVLSNDYFGALKARAEEVERAFRAATPKSAAKFQMATNVFPGGFTRDAVMRSPYAPFMVEGHGSKLTDADGRHVVDFWFNASSMIMGHGDPRVTKAVHAQIDLGTAFYAPTDHELKLAQLLIDRIPSAERVRFTNSGSEAVMIAVRHARGFTKRDLIVKCEGSYHGAYDDMQWSVAPPKDRLGSADKPTAVPDSGGLPDSAARVLIVPFNNVTALERLVRSSADRIAAIIVEPMANRMGLIMPSKEFLNCARMLCHEIGAVLIFDEVIAFRLGFHGAQGFVGVTPDMTTLGKIIGGGFPVGALVGRADIMETSSPATKGRVTHAGTFNANPVTMVAGLKTMECLTLDVYEKINRKGEAMRAKLKQVFEGLPVQVTGVGSFFKINATGTDIVNYRVAVDVDGTWEEILSRALYTEGFLLTPHLHGCISSVTTDAEIDGFVAAVAKYAQG